MKAAFDAYKILDELETGSISCPYFSDSFLIDYTENAM